MNLKTFLEHFDTIAEALGGIPKLRSLILDLAVRGKLVPQNSEDEPASILIKKIQGYKDELCKLKQIPKTPKVQPIKEDEVAFDIPDNWTWSRLANVFLKITDGTHHSPPNSVQGDYKYITAKNIKDFGINLTNISYVTKEVHREIYSRCDPNFGDLLYIKDGATTGIVTVNQLEEEFSLLSSVGLLKTHQYIYPWFLCYAMRSPFFYEQVRSSMTGIAITRVTLQKLNSYIIPIPPLAEQKRIVEKVDELMGLCDRISSAKQTRDKLRQKLRESAIASLMNAETDEELDAAWAFVRDNWQNLSQQLEDIEDLRQAVLNLAVRGKLVSQNINDESVLNLLVRITDEKKSLIEAKKMRDASTLPLEENTFPCQIPNTWAWKRFGDVILDIEAGTSPECEKRPKNRDEWGVIKISAVSWNKFNPDENKALPANVEPRKEFEIKINDFIMSRANTSQLVGKSVVVEHLLPRLLLNDKTLRVIFPTCIEKRFFNLYNNSALARQYYAGEGTGTSNSMKNITREQIRNLPVPVPPLYEQKRIVAKVNELMKLCDQLETSLRQSQQRAENLAASAISHLTL